MNRLIIVEGLPASGKSTRAKKIADSLRKEGKKVCCVDEGEKNHPADYPDYAWEDFNTERKAILEKWKSFVENIDEDTVYVFNCIFLQNPMCESMMRFGMEEKESCVYICEIADVIRELNPLIIYLQQDNEEMALKHIINERGNDWLNAVIEYHTKQGYGKKQGLSGFNGYIKCLEERQRRELRILRQTGVEYRIEEAYKYEG